MSLKRKILILSLLLIFAVAAPLILLYASGYRYSPKKGRLEKTGILRVDTVPAEAAVYLDGRPARSTTPVSIGNLLPEQYLVRIDRTGYLPWEKSLPIESGKTTFAKGVVLVPEALPQLATGSPTMNGTLNEDGSVAAFINDDGNWQEIRRYDSADGNLLALHRFPSGQYERIDLELSPRGNLLLFIGHPSDDAPVIARVFRTDLPDSGDAEIATWTSDRPVYDWLEDGRRIVYLDGLSLLTAGSAETNQQTQLDFEPLDMLAIRGSVWLLQTNGRGEPEIAELELPELRQTGRVVPLPKPDYRLIQGNQRHLLLSGGGPDSGLLVDTENDQTVRLPQMTGAIWEKPGESGRLLAWNDFEIFILDPEDGQLALITRLGRPIYDCRWYPQGTMIVYSTDREVTAIELDSRGHRNTFSLATLERIGRLAIDEENKNLHFFGAIGQRQGIYERPL